MRSQLRLLTCAVLFLGAAFPDSVFAQAAATNTSDPELIGYEPNQESDVSSLEVDESPTPGFLQGSSLLLQPRAYYLDRDRDKNQDNVGLALGGAIKYKSGWWLNQLRLNATLFTSQDIYGPSDKDGTLLFKPGPEGFTVLGEANLTWRFAENTGMRIGRQRFELPYLGSHDIRMVPNTFEAFAVGDLSDSGLAWIAGYIDGIKRKNDDKFISMSEAAGADGTNKGVAMGSARYRFPDGTLLGATNQHSFDVFNTFFVKAEKDFALASDRWLGVNLQYTDQRSVGDNLIGDFDTNMIAAKLELKMSATTWRAAYSKTGSDRGIQKPYGNPANYLSVIVDDFDRAGEEALLLGITHDFGRIGTANVSMFANIVYGNTPDAGPNASPDETEYDFTADFRLKDGWTDRIWLRIRAAYIDQDEDQGGDDFLDFRIIANYDFTAL